MILEGNAAIHANHFPHDVIPGTPLLELSAELSTSVDNFVCNYFGNFHSPSTI
jgi:hypothetical protein